MIPDGVGRWRGETGKRERLKIFCPQRLTGSIPVASTNQQKTWNDGLARAGSIPAARTMELLSIFDL